MTLAQPPAALDQPYTYDTEVAGIQWLAANRIGTNPVEADLVANLRLQAFGNTNSAILGIFPRTIQKKSYVYLDSANVSGIAYYGYQNNVVTYNYPLAFLNTHKNLIYNDGGSEIYR